MPCFDALPAQLSTFVYMPQDVVLLTHSVFYEYAKVAVSEDFIHTLPTLLIFCSLVMTFWSNPPSIDETIKVSIFRKFAQLLASWLAISSFVWLWLVLQQIIYCSIWTYWNENEYREIVLPWWQRVWLSYFPREQPPVMSSSFLSWLLCMLLASMTVAGAFSLKYIKKIICSTLSHVFQGIFNVRCINWISTLLNKTLCTDSDELDEQCDKSELTSVSDLPSEVGNGNASNGHANRYPTSTGRGKKSSKSPEFVKAYETFSTGSSARTSATNIDANKHHRAF